MAILVCVRSSEQSSPTSLWKLPNNACINMYIVHEKSYSFTFAILLSPVPLTPYTNVDILVQILTHLFIRVNEYIGNNIPF
jgi:hypothetical protein